MRTEVVVSRLVATAQDSKASAADIAHAMKLMTRKVTEGSKHGAQALELLKKDLLKDALSNQIRVLKTEKKAAPTSKRAATKRGNKTEAKKPRRVTKKAA